MEDLTIRGSKSVKNIDIDAINADIEILDKNQEEPILSLIKNGPVHLIRPPSKTPFKAP